MGIFTEQIALLVKADTDAAVKPLSNLEKQSKSTDKAFVGMTRSVGVSADVMNRGLAQLKDFAIGAGVVATLTQVTTGFVDAANAANVLSQTTNSTIEQSSKFLAVAGQYGLELNDVVEIFADFQQSAAASGDELERLGVAIATNADGTTDWITTSVNFLGALDGITDATERNRLLFKYFGEEGAKQLIALTNSGLSLSEAMEKVTGLTAADVKAAQDYTVAMNELKASATDLSNTLGGTLAGAATTLARAVEPVAKVLGSLDGATLLLGAAAFGLSRYWDDLAAGASALRSGLANLGNAVIRPLTVDFGDLGLSAEKAGDKVEKANKKVSPKAMGTGTILAAAAAWEVASSAAAAYNSTVEQVAGTTADVSLLTDEDLRKVQDGLSLWEKFGQAIRSTFSWEGLKQNLLGPFFDDNNAELTQLEKDLKKAEEAQRDLAEVQGATAVAALDQKDAQQALSDALYDSSTSQADLESAVVGAAKAQADQNRVTEESKRLLDAAADATWRNVEATLAMQDKRYAARAADRDFNRTVEESNKVLASGKSSADERRAALDDVGESAIRAASAEVDYQRQLANTRGTALTAAEEQQIYNDTLRELEKDPALTDKQRSEIRLLREETERAQLVAEGGIALAVNTIVDEDGRKDAKRYIDTLSTEQVAVLVETGAVEDASVREYLEKRLQKDIDAEVKIKFNGKYATQDEVQREIDSLFSQGKISEAIALQTSLNATVKVNAIGPTGEPIGADGVSIPVTVTGQAEVETTLTTITSQEREAFINAEVRGWFAADALLDSLAVTRTATVNVEVSGIGAAERALNKDLNGNGIIGQALAPYRAMAYIGAGGRARGGDGAAVAYSVTGGVIEPKFAEPEQMQVNVLLDGRQIARYLEPVTRARRSA